MSDTRLKYKVLTDGMLDVRPPSSNVPPFDRVSPRSNASVRTLFQSHNWPLIDKI